MGDFDFSALFNQRPDYLQNYQNAYQNNPLRQDPSYYWNQESPDYQNYTKLAGEAPESEGILRDYISRAPMHENYEPSFGRKIGGFLLGMLSGMGNPSLAYTNAKRVTDDPYNDAMEDWKTEGTNISTRARLLDSNRNRELQSLKFGLDQAAKAKLSAQTNENRAQGNARGLSNGISTDFFKSFTDALAASRLNETKSQNDWMNAFRERESGYRQDRDRERQDYTELLRNQQLALQQEREARLGNPSSRTPEQQLKDRNAQEDLALKDARSVPMFKPILDAMRGADTNGQDPWSVLDTLEIDPQIKSNFKDYIASRLKRYGSK